MSVIVDFSIFPLDKGESLSPYVVRAVRLVKESGLPHVIGPMSTSVEGEWEEVMALVNRCFEEMKKDCDRISLALRADYRNAGQGRMKHKVEAVQADR